ECGVVGNEQLMGYQEAPYVGGMSCERILQAQSRIREAVKLFGSTAVSPTRIEYEVEIFQIRPAFGQVAADHSDAAKADDAVVITNSGGLNIAKRHRRRQVIPPHVPSSPSRCGATAHRPPRTPAEAWRRWRGRGEEADQGQASVSTC